MKMPKGWQYVPSWKMTPHYLAAKFAPAIGRRPKRVVKVARSGDATGQAQ